MEELELNNEPRANHAEYIASWIKVLKDDPKAIFTTSSKPLRSLNHFQRIELSFLI
jgi:antirestriction protein ArdC